MYRRRPPDPAGLASVRRRLRVVVSVSTHLSARPEPALALRHRANAGARAFPHPRWLRWSEARPWCPWTGRALLRRRRSMACRR